MRNPTRDCPIRNVRQRIFQGFCRDIDYEPIFQPFTEKREEMLSVVRNFDALDEDRRDRVIEYLGGLLRDGRGRGAARPHPPGLREDAGVS